MIELNEIDFLIHKLLDHLANIQCEDGSFNTLYRHKIETEDKWVKKGKQNASMDTASSLIPLLLIDSKDAEIIIKRAIPFLKESSLDNLVWRYIPGSIHQHEIPYDIDSTSLSSFILAKYNHQINNKNFLNLFINNEGYYNTYLLNKSFTFRLPIKTCIRLAYNNLRSTSRSEISIEKNDFETGTTCNALLYLGKMKANEKVWKNLEEDLANLRIKSVYFSLFYSVYAYARLIKYGNNTSMILSKEQLDKIMKTLYSQLNIEDEQLDKLFFINAVFLLDLHIDTSYDALIEKCFLDVQLNKYTEVEPYFTSHKVITKHHISYFGSPGVTSSLYLEFLNLYRKYTFKFYYKQTTK